MKHIFSLDNLHLKASWVTIGSFDGVHLGHQYLLRTLVEGAHAAKKSAVVVTFFPHPMVLLKGISKPFYLTLPEERKNILNDLGIDFLLTLDFNKRISSLTPLSFMKLMKKHIQLEHLLVGHDFVLGKDREGNVERLEEIGEHLGYCVEMIKPITNANNRISSSKIRDLIELGKVQEASKLLGRWYSVDCALLPNPGGLIGIQNQQLKLGHVPEKLLPRSGIYATLLHMDGKSHPSLTNIRSQKNEKGFKARTFIDSFLLDPNKTQTDTISIRMDIVKLIRQISPFESFNLDDIQTKSDLNLAYEVLKNAT
ncbi:MAG: hypothetical protein MUO76_12975 [Anaerolineaceae bacterium]|nr:hypothetical protein [Anaerolineaceae bacterium]